MQGNIPVEDEFRERVIKYRAQHGLSMEAFAKKCHLGRYTIWAVENKRRSMASTTKALIERAMEDSDNE